MRVARLELTASKLSTSRPQTGRRKLLSKITAGRESTLHRGFIPTFEALLDGRPFSWLPDPESGRSVDGGAGDSAPSAVG